jgi:hypothetical protein
VSGSRFNPLAASVSFYAIYVSSWTHGPEGCVSGDVHSDFQRGRCREFWSKVGQASGIAVAPFVLLALVYLLGMDSLTNTYRRARKKIESRKAIARGVVTNPARASNDFYGWLYGFRPISVDMGKGRQIRVYFPLEGRLPLPGDPVAVFTPGRAMGRHRFFGEFHAPHVAVIAGVGE